MYLRPASSTQGLEGVLKSDETIKEYAKDVGLISAAQPVEHYEIAGYDGVMAFAKMIGDQK